MPKDITVELFDTILMKSDLAKVGLTDDQRRDFENKFLEILGEYEARAPLATFRADIRDEVEKTFDEVERLVFQIDRFIDDDYFLRANGGDRSTIQVVLNDTLQQLALFAQEMVRAKERIDGLKGKPPNNLTDDPLAALIFDLLNLRGSYLKKEPPTSVKQTAESGNFLDFLQFSARLCNPEPQSSHVTRAIERAIESNRMFKNDGFWIGKFK